MSKIMAKNPVKEVYTGYLDSDDNYFKLGYTDIQEGDEFEILYKMNEDVIRVKDKEDQLLDINKKQYEENFIGPQFEELEAEF
jgi:hypothetical protein